MLCSAMLISCTKNTADDFTVQNNWNINWIDVRDRQFYDEQGRTIQLRGINARVDGLFDVVHADGRTANEIIPETTEEDIKGMAAIGFNLLRLPINWSAYEPERNEINHAYIDRIKEVVGWCKDAGIYVQIDWHSDAYSKEMGEDGAPYWAIFPAAFPKAEGIIDFDDLFAFRANPFVFLAFHNFFINYDGYQDEFLDVWEDIIREFKEENAVIGFEPANEPICSAAGLSDAVLMSFYERCSRSMRSIDTRHSLWLEPDAIRNFTEVSPLLTTPFIDNKVVYCPHYYPNLTQGASYAKVDVWKQVMKKAMDRIVLEGQSWNAPVCMNEWGMNPSREAGAAYVVAFKEMAEDRNIHHAFWLWKEPLPGTSGKDGNWGFYEHISGNKQWAERTEAKSLFAVPYAMAIPGILIDHRFDLTANSLRFTFESNHSSSGPVIYIPDNRYSNGFEIRLNGVKVKYEKDEYGRVAVGWNPFISDKVIIEVMPN